MKIKQKRLKLIFALPLIAVFLLISTLFLFIKRYHDPEQGISFWYLRPSSNILKLNDSPIFENNGDQYFSLFQTIIYTPGPNIYIANNTCDKELSILKEAGQSTDYSSTSRVINKSTIYVVKKYVDSYLGALNKFICFSYNNKSALIGEEEYPPGNWYNKLQFDIIARTFRFVNTKPDSQIFNTFTDSNRGFSFTYQKKYEWTGRKILLYKRTTHDGYPIYYMHPWGTPLSNADTLTIVDVPKEEDMLKAINKFILQNKIASCSVYLLSNTYKDYISGDDYNYGRKFVKNEDCPGDQFISFYNTYYDFLYDPQNPTYFLYVEVKGKNNIYPAPKYRGARALYWSDTIVSVDHTKLIQ